MTNNSKKQSKKLTTEDIKRVVSEELQNALLEKTNLKEYKSEVAEESQDIVADTNQLYRKITNARVSEWADSELKYLKQTLQDMIETLNMHIDQ